MISFEQRRLMHKYVVYDMAVQSLQRDYKVIENLKLSKVYLPILDRLLEDISQECYNAKRLLAKDKIRVVRWVKTDEYFSDLIVATAGEDAVFTYANMALKTQVENLLISHQNKDQALNWKWVPGHFSFIHFFLITCLRMNNTNHNINTIQPIHLKTLIELKSKFTKKIAAMIKKSQSVDDILFIKLWGMI